MHGRDATKLRLVGTSGPGADGPVLGGLAGDSVLRLVARSHEASPSRPRRAARQHRVAQRAVVEENRAAAGLRPDDARAILAARVAESIEGGKAAVLRPAARKGLLTLGTTLGLRPFDTSLVIAIVQDRARAGQDAQDEARLSMVSGPALRPNPRAVRTDLRTMLLMLAAAGALALGVFGMLVRWVTRP